MASAGYVIDASALLCLLFRESGAERVEAVLAGARMGTPNLAEVVAKLVERGADGGTVVVDLAELDLEIVPLDRPQAEASGLAARAHPERRPVPRRPLLPRPGRKPWSHGGDRPNRRLGAAGLLRRGGDGPLTGRMRASAGLSVAVRRQWA